MWQYRAPWSIVAADATTIVLNDVTTGLWLEDVTGFDSPDIRTQLDVLAGADGAIAGPSYLGARPFTLSGKVGVGRSSSQRNADIATLQRALRGLRLPATFKSTPDGMAAMQIAAYVQSLRVKGGRVKDFQIAAIAPDPRIYSQTLHDTTSTGTSPRNVAVTNAGNYETPPVLVVTGPAQDAQLLLVETGDTFNLSGYTVPAGHTLTIDMAAATAIDDQGASQYPAVVFPTSKFWRIPPGNATVRLTCGASTGATALEVKFRDAWV